MLADEPLLILAHFYLHIYFQKKWRLITSEQPMLWRVSIAWRRFHVQYRHVEVFIVHVLVSARYVLLYDLVIDTFYLSLDFNLILSLLQLQFELHPLL